LKRRLEIKGKKTYIIPSRFGLFYLMILFLSIIISVSFGHPFSYFFTSLLFVIFIISAFWANSYVSNLNVSSFNQDSLVQESKDFSLRLNISGPGQDIINCQVQHDKGQSVDIFEDRSEAHISVHSSFSKWGVKDSIRVKLSSSYPYFLFYTWKYINLEDRVYVYPSVDQTEMNKLIDKNLQEFSDIEIDEYHKGDPLSRIYWKKVSSTGKYYIKQDVGGDSEINILDEAILQNESIENGVGVLCHSIHNHIKSGKSFAYKSKDGRLKIVSHRKNMLNIAKRLISEN